ncbi:MAG TPA: hypothetical protein VGG41_10915 [Solirubrobacteraceae bacterium]|jgi:hypothetical protein
MSTRPAGHAHGLARRLRGAILLGCTASLMFAVPGFALPSHGTTAAVDRQTRIHRATATEALFQPTCQSGQTLFLSGAVRAFKMTDSSDQQAAFVCSSASAAPVVIDNPGPAVQVEAGDFHIRGGRLGFVLSDFGLGTGPGGDTELGWVDLQTGEVALGLLNAGPGNGPPQLPDDVVSYAFAPDGTTAVIAGTTCEVVATLAVRARPDGGGYRLGLPVVLFTARHGGLVHWSITITTTTVKWRGADGAKGSAPLLGGSPGTPAHTRNC